MSSSHTTSATLPKVVSTMIRVLLVDDHTLVRAGVQRLLDHADDIEVAGIADGGDEAVILADILKPDVVLMDLSMPGLDGVESTRQICASESHANVVMLTAHSDRSSVVDALDAGAIGYLIKDIEPAELLQGVRAAASGEAPLDPRAARALLEDRRHTPSKDLTERETEVLMLVASGMANKAIARRLGISEKTVKAHLTRIYSELEVSDRTQATIWARENLAAFN